MNQSLFSRHQSPSDDPEVRAVWEVIESAVADGYVTSEMAVESLEGLEHSGGKSWDEFGLVSREEHPGRVEAYYGRDGIERSCDQDALLRYYRARVGEPSSTVQPVVFRTERSLDQMLADATCTLPSLTWAIHDSEYEGRYLLGRVSDGRKLKLLALRPGEFELECWGGNLEAEREALTRVWVATDLRAAR